MRVSQVALAQALFSAESNVLEQQDFTRPRRFYRASGGRSKYVVDVFNAHPEHMTQPCRMLFERRKICIAWTPLVGEQHDTRALVD
jgi:hypothetical protein